MIYILRLAENPRLKNLQDGGLSTYGNATESKKKFWETRKNNNKLGLHKNTSGENSGSNKVTEKEVLEIYDYIKKFYSNSEILENLNFKIGVSALNQIRTGVNWKYLWQKEGMKFIPSAHKEKNGIPTIEKIKLLRRLLEEEDMYALKQEYKLFSITDLKRIKAKNIWKPIWNIYETINYN